MGALDVRADGVSGSYGITLHRRLALGRVKKPGIVHSLQYSTPTLALLNDADPTRV